MTHPISTLAVGLVALLALAQLVPVRPGNPPQHTEPAWDGAQTADLARRACYDCHSNRAAIPWYGQVAPFAWIVRDHMEEGRAVLNLSELDRPQPEAHEAGEEVMEGEMPPAWYVVLHPEAALTADERRLLARGLDATLASSPATADAGEHGRDGHHDD